jgi:hypothetical protein
LGWLKWREEFGRRGDTARDQVIQVSKAWNSNVRAAGAPPGRTSKPDLTDTFRVFRSPDGWMDGMDECHASDL